jgi:hypothetical protein
MRTAYLLLALPFATACIGEPPPPPVTPVADAPPPAEHVVVSAVEMTGSPRSGETASARAPRASDADRVRPDPVFFRIGAGYGAVGRVDLAPCRERGLDTGYVHMRVTFAGNGTVAHAAIESPTPPPPDALACIGEQLQAAAVPAFEGGDVTLSKSLFVVGTAGPPEVFVKEGAPTPPTTASR